LAAYTRWLGKCKIVINICGGIILPHKPSNIGVKILINILEFLEIDKIGHSRWGMPC